MAYIARLLREDGEKAQSLRMGNGQAIAYHSHCQQRTLGLERSTVSVLETLGYDVMTSDKVECCGMAGSFGYKQEYYELSMQVGEALRTQFAPAVADGRIVAASGTSCQEQLEALLGGEALHPIEIIAPGG
jgi:Fe-S oxidoreductase